MSYYGYCPECGSQLKLIESNDGDFLRCTEYPYCSYVKKWNFEYDELQKDEVSFIELTSKDTYKTIVAESSTT